MGGSCHQIYALYIDRAMTNLLLIPSVLCKLGRYVSQLVTAIVARCSSETKVICLQISTNPESPGDPCVIREETRAIHGP